MVFGDGGDGGDRADGVPKQLRDFLKRPSLVLWLGAGASRQAEPPLPTLVGLAEALRRQPGADVLPKPGEPGVDPYRVFDRYLDERIGTRGDLEAFLESQFRPEGKDPRPGDLHRHLARIAAGGKLTAVIDPNYDHLLRPTFRDERVSYTFHVLDQNLHLPDAGLHYLAIHGGQDDWTEVVLTGESYETFNERYRFLQAQLDVLLLRDPVLFVGSSLEDPRLLEWLDGLEERDRRRLKSWLAVVGPGTAQRLAHENWKDGRTYEAALSDHLRLVELPSFDHLPAWFGELASEVAPPPAAGAAELVIEIEAGEDEWRVRGEGAEALREPPDLGDSLVRLRRATGEGFPVDANGQPAPEDRPRLRELEAEAAAIGEAITALIPEGLRSALVHAVRSSFTGGPAVVRLKVSGPATNRALLLPWELLRTGGDFPVRDGKIHLLREVALEGLETGFPEEPQPLSVVAHLAAPEGGEPELPPLNLEEAELRMARALDRIGSRTRFTEMGTLHDLEEAVRQVRPTLLHFAGHGMPGRLVFESDDCGPSPQPVGEVVRRLTQAHDRLPLAVWLSCCYGAGVLGEPRPGRRATAREPLAATREWGAHDAEAPSVCADLHRQGLPQVLGYFGPVPDPLAVEVDRRLFESLATDGDTLEAVRQARLATRGPITTSAGKVLYPLSWALLALYHRGPVRGLAAPVPSSVPGPAVQPGLAPALLDLEGVEVLERGFIGRRRLLAKLRRLHQEGEACLGLYGLGGLGKTATLTRLSAILAGGDADWQKRVLVIPAGQYGEKERGAASPLRWLQLRIGALPGKQGEQGEAGTQWEERLKEVDQSQDPPADLARLLLELAGPGGIVYVDNAETFQAVEAPAAEGRREGEAGGDERVPWIDDDVARFFTTLCGEVAGGTTVLVTTRYRPTGTPGRWESIPACSPAEIFRMTAWYPTLRRLPSELRRHLAENRLSGHPRGVQWVEALVHDQEQRFEERGGGRIRPDSPVDEVRREILDPALDGLPGRIENDLALARHLIARLEPSHRALLGECSAIGLPVPWQVIESLGQGDAPTRSRGAATLRNHGLLTRFSPTDDAWAVHPFVRDFHRGGGADSGGASRLAWTREGRHRLGLYWGIRGLESKSPAEMEEALRHLIAAEAWSEAGEALRRLSIQLRFQGLWRNRLALLEGLSEVPWPDEQKAKDWLYNLADALTDVGSYRRAADLFRKSLEIQQRVYDTREHAEIAASLHGLANVLTYQGRYADAEAAYRESIEIKQRVYDTREHAEIAASLHGLANVLARQEKEAEAEDALREVLRIEELVFGRRHPLPSVSTMVFLGRFLLRRDSQSVEALELFQAAWSTAREHGAVMEMIESGSALSDTVTAPDKTDQRRLFRAELEAVLESVPVEHPARPRLLAILEQLD